MRKEFHTDQQIEVDNVQQWSLTSITVMLLNENIESFSVASKGQPN